MRPAPYARSTGLQRAGIATGARPQTGAEEARPSEGSWSGVRMTLSRARAAVIGALRADEVLNDPRGWTANLAIFRIVFLGFCVLPWALRFLEWSQKVLPTLSRDMWVPISFYRLLPVGLLGNVGFAQGLAVADIVLITLGIVGFYTRSSIGLATLISLYAFGLMENVGKVDHFHHLIWFMALLAAGPSGHFLSMDALRRGIRSADRGNIEPSFPPTAALWTLRYTWLLMGVLYLGTGIAKLQSALTARWAGAANLHNILWRKWLELHWYDPHFAGVMRVDSLPQWMLGLLGASVIAFEIGFILAVFFRRARPFLGLGGLAFHVGNGVLLKIWFTTLMVAYVSLFDWTAMGRAVWRTGREPLLVLYDGGCRFCRRTLAILRSFDMFDALRPVAAVSNDPSRIAYPQVSDEMLTRDMYAAAGGRIAAGYDAYAWMARRVFLLWPIAVVMPLGWVKTLGQRIYRGVADSRHCSLVVPEAEPQATAGRPQFRLLHRLGLSLAVCQLGISSFMLLYSLQDVYLPAQVPSLKTARRLVNGLGKRGPVWPFDLYPTFAPITPSNIAVWEARWVTSSGGEIRVSPSAYDQAFGNSALVWNITTGMAGERDPARSQARSLDLVRLLWRAETPEIRQSATAVNIYRAEYRLQADENARPLRESLLHSFPLGLIAGAGSPGLPARPQAGLDPQWIAFSRAGSHDVNLQCFRPDNVSLSGGNLVITTKSETATCSSIDLPPATHHYTSGYVSMRSFNFLYGTVEFRAKFGGGAKTGAWPAVWMADASCQSNDPTGTDQHCNGQEIDIAEIMNGNFKRVNQQIHVNHFSRNDGCNPSATDTSKNFHVYQLVWGTGSLVFKIDGKTTCKISRRYVPAAPMYVKIDMYVGSYGGSVKNRSLPWTTLVDYVKVTQGSTVVFDDDFDL
jgi:predicted DCC family thiol-disulfide oxidoreductase YuxK